MSDLLANLNAMKRPRLLINAARLGVSDYRRDAHLPRHLGVAQLPQCSDALAQLMEIEHDLDCDRRAQTTGYSVAQHVEILIAVMAEARLVRAAHLS